MRRGLWAAHPAGPHAWNRGGVWDAYFAVVLAATLLIVFSTSNPAAARLVAAIALAATVPLYILVGRPAIAADRDTRRGTIYVVCMVALVVVAQTQVGPASWVMFAACPQCFMALSLPVRGLRPGPAAACQRRGGAAAGRPGGARQRAQARPRRRRQGGLVV